MNKREQVKNNIRIFVEEQYNQSKFSGSILAADKEGIIFSDSYGLANMEHNIPNTMHTKYRIGSLTKPFTALAVLQLIENEKFKVEDCLSNFIPDYPNGQDITIHHLLSHTSAIYNFSNNKDIMDWYKTSPTMLEIIDSFKDNPLSFTIGEKYEYSNSNYILLTHIIELITGCTYEEYLRKNIFDPLQMNDSGYDNESEIIKGRANGYYFKDDELCNAPYINMKIPSGAGGLYSTIEDLYKWDRGLYGQLLLNNDSKTKMFTPYTERYAYGWMVQYFNQRKVLFHTGGIHGFSAFLCRFIEEEVCVIAISNYSQKTGGLGAKVSQIIFE